MINQIYSFSSLATCIRVNIYILVYVYIVLYHLFYLETSHSLQSYNGKSLFHHLFPIHFSHTRSLSLLIFRSFRLCKDIILPLFLFTSV